MPIEPTHGLLIAKRYRLERCLGEGGMGAVWAATHTITGKTLALKFLKAPEARREVLTQRFLREARAACAVEHPNIVQVYDVLELDDGSPVMVMEMLAGESLQQKLARETRIGLAELSGLLLPVLSAVGCAHAAGVVHRDLKPDNIFLARGVDGSTTVKVLDFGIAKLVLPEGVHGVPGLATGTGMMMGTPYYMSPEQVGADKSIDGRSDIWSLGIILYQCLTGMLPTRAESLGQILTIILVGPLHPLSATASWLPADVTGLVDRMLSRDRELRPRELSQVSAVLERHALTRANAPVAPRVEEPARPRLAPAPAAATAVHFAPSPPIAPTLPVAGGFAPLPAGPMGAAATGVLPAQATGSGGSTQAPFSRSVAGLPKPMRGVGLALVAVVALGVAGLWIGTRATLSGAFTGVASSAEPEAMEAVAPSAAAASEGSAPGPNATPPPASATALLTTTPSSAPVPEPPPTPAVKPTASARAPAAAPSTPKPPATAPKPPPQARATATSKRHEGIH